MSGRAPAEARALFSAMDTETTAMAMAMITTTVLSKVEENDEQKQMETMVFSVEDVDHEQTKVEVISDAVSSLSHKRKKPERKKKEKPGKKRSFVYGNYIHYYGYRVCFLCFLLYVFTCNYDYQCWFLWVLVRF